MFFFFIKQSLPFKYIPFVFVSSPTQHFNHGPVNLEVLEWQHVSDNITVINLRPVVRGSISILRWKLRERLHYLRLHAIELSLQEQSVKLINCIYNIIFCSPTT